MRVAIIGTGFMSEFHARAIQKLGHELAMIADCDEKKARDFATKYNCPWTTSNEELFSQKLDLVTITVPNIFHFEVASAAVAAGHAVLCEKPMTRSAEQSRKLVAMVKAQGKPFFVGYMKRAHPTVQRYREMVQKIGIPRSGLVRVFHPCLQVDRQNIVKAVSENPKGHFDGVLVNSGSHMLDLLLHVAGPVKRIIAARMQYLPKAEIIDITANALLEMESGATVMVECGWLPLSGVGRREDGWDEVFELRGEDGLAKLYTTWWSRPEEERPVAELWYEPTKTRESFNAGFVDYFTGEYELIEKGLTGQQVPLATAEEACKVDELIEGVFEAAKVQ